MSVINFITFKLPKNFLFFKLSISAPNSKTERLVNESAVKESLKTINTFFESKWKAYRLQTEAKPMKLFKDYKPIE